MAITERSCLTCRCHDVCVVRKQIGSILELRLLVASASWPLYGVAAMNCTYYTDDKEYCDTESEARHDQSTD
jgi:hypothetical protein